MSSSKAYVAPGAKAQLPRSGSPVQGHFEGSANRSTRTPSESEFNASIAIDHTLRELSQFRDCEILWFSPSYSSQRQIANSREISKSVRQILHGARADGRHPFWDFYSHESGDNIESPEGLKQKYFEYDYFAYVGRSTDASPIEDSLYRRSSTVFENSAVNEKRPACIFEITASTNWKFKFAQLELRLAVWAAKRQPKGQTLTVCVAAAGVCIPSRFVDTARKSLLDETNLSKLFPNIFALVQSNIPVLVIPSDTLPQERVRSGPPSAVWVQQLSDSTMLFVGSAFMAFPRFNFIDGLKKAIREEKPSLKDVDADRLTIYTQDAAGKWIEVTKQSTALKENAEETPYGFVPPRG